MYRFDIGIEGEKGQVGREGGVVPITAAKEVGTAKGQGQNLGACCG